MVKQVKIIKSETLDTLQKNVNDFCVDYFPEEIVSISIKLINGDKPTWLGVIIYVRDEYQ